MLKRKLYWLAMGVVVCQLSIAAIQKSQDCADCALGTKFPNPIASVDLPLKKNLLAGYSGFTDGNGNSQFVNGNFLNAQMDAIAKEQKDAAQAQASVNMPPVVPRPQYFPNGFPKPTDSDQTSKLRLAYQTNDVRGIMGVLTTYMPQTTWQPFVMTGYAGYGFGSPFAPF
jgi:hypothetical protein